MGQIFRFNHNLLSRLIWNRDKTENFAFKYLSKVIMQEHNTLNSNIYSRGGQINTKITTPVIHLVLKISSSINSIDPLTVISSLFHLVFTCSSRKSRHSVQCFLDVNTLVHVVCSSLLLTCCVQSLLKRCTCHAQTVTHILTSLILQAISQLWTKTS